MGAVSSVLTLKQDLLSCVRNNYPYLKYSNGYFILNDIKHATDDELFIAKKKIQFGKNKCEIEIRIDNLDTALTYSYKYLYELIMENKIMLSSDLLNDIFHFEILSRDLFTDAVKKSLENYRITRDGFIKYLKPLLITLTPDKLQLLNFLTDVRQSVLADFRNYYEMIEYFKNVTSFEKVEQIALVMGYPFVKSKNNKIVEFCELLKQTFNCNITIYRKGDAKFQKENINICYKLKQIGINLKTFDDYKLFHDRYILFKTRSRDFYFLSTCEIGHFFHPTLGDPTGAIIPIKANDLIKDNLNLIALMNRSSDI